MPITQSFNVDMIPQTVPVIVPVNQYDVGINRLVINLYRGSVKYYPSGNTSVLIQGIKPDKKGFQYQASIAGNVVTANLTEQMTACYGDVITQVVVKEANDTFITGTFVFILRVQRSALQEDTDISETELPDIIDAAESYALRAEQAANYAENCYWDARDAVAHYPYIDEDTHNWMVYDIDSEEWIDTGINATGDVSMRVQDSCLYITFDDTNSDINNNS